MKTTTRFKRLLWAAFFTAGALSPTAKAQTGMDYDGGPLFHYSGLRDPGGSFISRLFNDEKALGVYQIKNITPLSYLEVNTNSNHLPFPMPGLALNEVFRTNSGINSSFWRMFTLNVEYGELFNNANSDFNLQATVGKLWFLSNGPINRVLVDDNSTNGSVGMGDVLAGTFVPQSRLHLNMSTASPCDLRFTNASTGITFTDGFRMGITPSGLTSRLAMLEPNGDMRFATGLADRVIILPNGFVGINTLTPNNWLEINGGTACNSGLRFTTLTSACAPVANPGTGVLGVDPSGNVIYVNSASFITGANNGLTVTGGIVQLGNGLCNGTGQFTVNREVPLNNFNLYFNDATTNTGSLSIGNSSCVPITSRLDVINQSKVLAGFFSTTLSNTGGIAGLRGQSFNTGTGPSVGLSGSGQSTGGSAIGVSCVSLGGSTSPTTFSIGCSALSMNPSGSSTQVIAVNGQSKNGGTYSISGNFDVIGSSSPQNYGIQVEVQGNTFAGVNYGGQFIVGNNAPGSLNYGVYSRCLPAPNSGLGPNWAGFFDGDVWTTSAMYYGSDRNLKRDINHIENSLDIVKKLNPVSYYFDTENKKDVGINHKKQYGFISQEVQQILPELTATGTIQPLYDSLGKETSPKQEYLGINYNGFIAILTKAVQEQQKMIDEQQKQIDELKSMMGTGSNLQQNNNGGANVNQLNVNLSDKDIIVLDQNTPNPFAEQTTISYNLPETVGKAQLLFYNIEGKLINSLDLQKGKGQVTVFANDLSNGIYSYTLVVDGKITDTKKMIRNK